MAVLKHQLMIDPHYEDDAQRYHELTTRHFAPDFDHRKVTRLRICCLQPSPTWKEYGLHHLKFYSIQKPEAPPLQPPPPSLSQAERELASTIVDHLLGLGQITREIRQTLGSARRAGAQRRQADDVASLVVAEWTDEWVVSSPPSRGGSTASSLHGTPTKK